jgi:hypothetical protein
VSAANPLFRVPYSRPKSLSDPHHGNFEYELKELLNTPDENLTFSDFRSLLGPYLPAGTYEETCYFLPLAFTYILAHDDDALEFVTSLVWYCSEYADKLRADRILEDSRQGIRKCLDHWTKQFEVVHFDAEGCRARGWGLEHFDYVRNMEVVGQALDDLMRFFSHSDLAVAFITELCQSNEPVKQAWFLEFLRGKLKGDAYCPPNYEEIDRLFENKRRIRSLVATVKNTVVPFEKSPTYWSDSLALVEKYCVSDQRSA